MQRQAALRKELEELQQQTADLNYRLQEKKLEMFNAVNVQCEEATAKYNKEVEELQRRAAAKVRWWHLWDLFASHDGQCLLLSTHPRSRHSRTD
jgi:DNA repair exonuclease SbcCD ATPase subunit